MFLDSRSPESIVTLTHEGFTATVPAARARPFVLVVGIPHFLMGSAVVLGSLGSGLVALLGGIATMTLEGVLAGLGTAALSLPFAAFGSVFATWPVLLVRSWLTTHEIDVAGSAVRIRKRYVGYEWSEDTVPLADCFGARYDNKVLELADKRLPMEPNMGAEIARLLADAAVLAAGQTDQLPPTPEALQKLLEQA